MSASPTPGLREALAFWLRLGFISFGGPAGQIALMQQELVERRRWLSQQQFLHALNYCMLLPGPEAQQLATYLGWLLHRSWGGIAAGVLFILPSLLLMIGLGWLYMVQGQSDWLEGLFYGIKPAITAVVLHAAWRIGRRALHGWQGWAIAAAAFLGLALFGLPFPLIIGVAALLGWLGQRWRPAPGMSADEPPFVSAPHTRFRMGFLLQVLAAGLALWCLPMLLLWLAFGWQGTLTQMAWFFTKAALLSFGGAYAVLPYLYQGAVLQFAWVTPGQMLDGLALGESTPGPLIMVVSFIAFLGAWPQAIPGIGNGLAAGALAALLVCWFTFLPSFIFILAGAPLVEASHGQPRLAAALSGISAAVVGVVLHLALFFGYQLVWPQGPGGAVDWLALIIGIGAALALFVWQRPLLVVLGVCALFGLLGRLAGLF